MANITLNERKCTDLGRFYSGNYDILLQRKTKEIRLEVKISMQELINFHEYPIKNILDVLLKDRTTNKNIIFATNEYSNINKTLTEKVKKRNRNDSTRFFTQK